MIIKVLIKISNSYLTIRDFIFFFFFVYIIYNCDHTKTSSLNIQ